MDDMAAERFALLYTNGHQLKSKQIQGTYLFGGGSMGGVENLSGPGSLVNQWSTPQIAEKNNQKTHSSLTSSSGSINSRSLTIQSANSGTLQEKMTIPFGRLQTVVHLTIVIRI